VFLACIKKIAANSIASATRHAQSRGRDVRRRTDDPMALAGVTQDQPPERPAIAAEVTVYLAEAIERLGADEGRTITLRYYEHRSFKEIAEELGREEGTVRVIHMRALRKLHDLLGDSL
jgi:RNA polymerase sigma factor (sigma-70 family)